MGVSQFFIGIVMQKPEGVSNMSAEVFQVAGFNDQFRYADFPEGWEPSARLKAQDRDGVEAEVLYASPSRFFYSLTDAPFQRSVLRSYALWLHDFCSAAPERLIGVPLLTILDMEKTVQDIHEYRKLGFKVVQLPTGIKDSGYYDPVYEPMWRAAAETGLILTVHTTSTQGVPRPHFEGPRPHDPKTATLGQSNGQAAGLRFVSNLIFSGVFHRYPDLKGYPGGVRRGLGRARVPACELPVRPVLLVRPRPERPQAADDGLPRPQRFLDVPGRPGRSPDHGGLRREQLHVGQ